VELFRLGRDRSGRAELHLRLRCEEGLLEARLLEDGAQGVRVALGGSLGDAQLDRLARALSRQGYEASLHPGESNPGGTEARKERRRPRNAPSDEEQAALGPSRIRGSGRRAAAVRESLRDAPRDLPSSPPSILRPPLSAGTFAGRSYLS
jgi:hypothetical protein